MMLNTKQSILTTELIIKFIQRKYERDFLEKINQMFSIIMMSKVHTDLSVLQDQSGPLVHKFYKHSK